MNIVILGSGFVARAFESALRFYGFFPVVLSRSSFDYTKKENLFRLLTNPRRDLLINCAGYTGDTVDDCEKNRSECAAANHAIAHVAADCCASTKPKTDLIHISTGCIFDGPGPFSETDVPNFTENFYQWTKVAAERSVLTMHPTRSWIFRIRMPFSHVDHPHNWLMKLCKYDCLLDGINSVTWLDQFASRAFLAWREGKISPGIYHWTSGGAVRTKDIFDLLEKAGLRDPCIKRLDTDEFLKTHVKRSETILDCSKFEKAVGLKNDDALPTIQWCIRQLSVDRSLAKREADPA